MKKWLIDRFEEDCAVLECDGKVFDLPRDVLPQGVKEGDTLQVSIDKEETLSRKEKADKLLNELFGE